MTLNINNYFTRSELSPDTFEDFKPKIGVTLNIPKLNDANYSLIPTIETVMILTKRTSSTFKQ